MHEETNKDGSRRGEGARGVSAPAILIVDDDPDMRAYVRDCLGPLSDRVIEAADGAEALAIVRDAGPGAFDLIIADVVMPGLDGLALRKELSADPALGAPEVLLVTGEVPGPGDEPILRKPFNAGTLRERVDALLARAR
jgi:CheY-like chemotaxis protein